jgi:hypothetical protein
MGKNDPAHATDEDISSGGSGRWQERDRLADAAMSREASGRSVLWLRIHLPEPERDSDPASGL